MPKKLLRSKYKLANRTFLSKTWLGLAVDYLPWRRTWCGWQHFCINRQDRNLERKDPWFPGDGDQYCEKSELSFQINKDATMMPWLPTPPKGSPIISRTTVSASSYGADSAKLMELEAKLQQTIENQDFKFKDILTQIMVFFQTTSQSMQGYSEVWILPKEANHGPIQMDNGDVVDQAARQMGITRNQAIELNAIRLRDLAEGQMSKAPNGIRWKIEGQYQDRHEADGDCYCCDRIAVSKSKFEVYEVMEAICD